MGLGNLGSLSGSGFGFGFGSQSDIPGGDFGNLACISDHVAGLGRGRLGRLGGLRHGALSKLCGLSNLRCLGDRDGLADGRFTGHERLGSLRNLGNPGDLDSPSDLGALSTDRPLPDPSVAFRRFTGARNLLATVPAGHGPCSRHGHIHRRGVSGSGLASTGDRVTAGSGDGSRTLLGTGNSPVDVRRARGHRHLHTGMTGHRLGNRRDTGSNNSRLLPRVHTLLRSGPGHPSHRRLRDTDRLLRGNNRFGSRRLRARRPGGRRLGGGAPGRRRLRDRGVEVLGAHRDRAGLADRCADGAAVGEERTGLAEASGMGGPRCKGRRG
ncbi:hypothetical protein KJK32_09005 [Streptomyces sp. JCM17656]|nr:hypothetical protein KJK32_09005 [Streptomyces sp. JCM17656]